MAIAPLFASENDAPRPAFSTPFRHGDHLFASDGRIALVCSDTGSVNETEDEMQKHIGNRLINEHIKTCEDNIACGKYRSFDLGKLSEAVCAAFANVEPDMMELRMNLPDDDPDEDFEPDSVRHVHSVFTSVIMANPARSVVAGYYASLIYGLVHLFGPADAYSDVRNPHDILYFRGSCWRCVLMPRLAKGRGISYEWNYYGGCAIADAISGKLVWGRECSAISPDMDTLRKGAAK